MRDCLSLSCKKTPAKVALTTRAVLVLISVPAEGSFLPGSSPSNDD